MTPPPPFSQIVQLRGGNSFSGHASQTQIRLIGLPSALLELVAARRAGGVGRLSLARADTATSLTQIDRQDAGWGPPLGAVARLGVVTPTQTTFVSLLTDLAR